MAEETFRTLYVDPGDETGWCVGRGFKLLAGGQEKLWVFADEVWNALSNPNASAPMFNRHAYARSGVEPTELIGPIGRIVCEDFRLYPNKLQDLKWNPVRTARLIGALTWMANHHNIPFVLQPASIKEAAQSAGATELYVTPHYQNRHHNDAIQHFVYFTNVELRQVPNN
jgi:hypothetical protein